jgi:hypothetical protein
MSIKYVLFSNVNALIIIIIKIEIKTDMNNERLANVYNNIISRYI